MPRCLPRISVGAHPGARRIPINSNGPIPQVTARAKDSKLAQGRDNQIYFPWIWILMECTTTLSHFYAPRTRQKKSYLERSDQRIIQLSWVVSESVSVKLNRRGSLLRYR